MNESMNEWINAQTNLIKIEMIIFVSDEKFYFVETKKTETKLKQNLTKSR